MTLTRRQIREGIRVVERLLRGWDPIGVLPEDPGSPAWSEYDSYAPKILGMLVHGAREAELLAHLRIIRTDRMGLPPNDSRDEVTATELVRWWMSRGG